MQLIFSVSPELTASSALRIPHDSFEPLLISLHGVFFSKQKITLIVNCSDFKVIELAEN